MSAPLKNPLTRPTVICALLLITCLPSSVAASTHVTQPTQHQIWIDQIVVKFKSSKYSDALKDEILHIAQLSTVSLTYLRAMSGDAHVLRLPAAVPISEAARIAESIAQQDDVAYAVPDALAQPHGVATKLFADVDESAPNDFYYAKQWSLKAPDAKAGVYGLNAEPAWVLTTGDPDLVIAVIDTGVLSTHPDLAGRLLPGYDFISSATIANDAQLFPTRINRCRSQRHSPIGFQSLASRIFG